MLELTWTRRLVTLALLVYASYSDFRSREVDDKVWIALCALSAPLTLLELLELSRGMLLLYALSSYTAFTVGLALSAFELMGWADFLALACIGITTPPGGGAFLTAIPAISVLVNSLLASLTYPLYLLARNLHMALRGEDLFKGIKASKLEKALAIMTLTKVSAREYSEKRDFYSIAEVEAGGIKRLSFHVRIREAHPVEVEDSVWVSPYMPFILFITVGYLLHILAGCLVDVILRYAP